MEMEIDAKEFTAAIEDLNASGLATVKVERKAGMSDGDIVAAFLTATESVPLEKESGLPPTVVEMYNDIVSSTSEETPSDAGPDPEDKDVCDASGVGWDVKAKECTRCKEDYPEEYDSCRKASIQAKKVAKVPGDTTEEVVVDQKEEKVEEKAPVDPGKVEEEGENVEAFEKLVAKVASRNDSKITYILDKMLVAGAKMEDMLARGSAVAKEKGLKSYSSMSDVKGLISSRKREGWILETTDDFVKLVGIKK